MVECMKTLPRETLREIMERLPPEERLHGLPHEQIASALSPEERLQGLPHEQIASALSPEERLRGLTPEDIQRLSPELREQLRRLLH
jgi:predicted nucleotidyltransferase